MSKNLSLLFFVSLICLQIALPVSMIAKRESTLHNGQAFRFKTAPVDPYDAFRGRYVALRVAVNKVSKPLSMDLKPGQKVYALLYVDTNGIAQVSQITLQKPKGSAYVKASVMYPVGNDVELNLPIDRYYMEEKAAPRAEQIYWEHRRLAKQDAYVIVKILDGFAVVEGLYIGEQRIEEVLKKI